MPQIDYVIKFGLIFDWYEMYMICNIVCTSNQIILTSVVLKLSAG